MHIILIIVNYSIHKLLLYIYIIIYIYNHIYIHIYIYTYTYIYDTCTLNGPLQHISNFASPHEACKHQQGPGQLQRGRRSLPPAGCRRWLFGLGHDAHVAGRLAVVCAHPHPWHFVRRGFQRSVMGRFSEFVDGFGDLKIWGLGNITIHDIFDKFGIWIFRCLSWTALEYPGILLYIIPTLILSGALLRWLEAVF